MQQLESDTPPKSLRNVARRLNELFRADPAAFEGLLKMHARANQNILRDRRVQFLKSEDPEGALYSFGLLGVLNGLHAQPPWVIVARFRNDKLRGFGVTRVD